jgi:predicted ABC-type ATPase
MFLVNFQEEYILRKLMIITKNKMILIIVRGLPGSGKSTFAQLLGTKAICTADDYHTHKGVYNWLPENVGKAHDWCQRKCRRFMKVRVDRIVVANTSTTERELKPYIDLARQFGYTVYSVIVENRHGGQNIHNVPEETLAKMAGRFTIKLI